MLHRMLQSRPEWKCWIELCRGWQPERRKKSLLDSQISMPRAWCSCWPSRNPWNYQKEKGHRIQDHASRRLCCICWFCCIVSAVSIWNFQLKLHRAEENRLPATVWERSTTREIGEKFKLNPLTQNFFKTFTAESCILSCLSQFHNKIWSHRACFVIYERLKLKLRIAVREALAETVARVLNQF